MVFPNFKTWIFNEGNKEDATSLLNNDSNKFNQMRSWLLNTSDKNKSKHYVYLAYFFNNNPQNEINNIEELINKNKISNIILKSKLPTIVYPNGKEQPFNDWLTFTETIHSLKDADRPIYKTEEVDKDLTPIFDKNNIKVYRADGAGQCVMLGKGQKFCISQPGNTMYQSYRDSQVSTFYFVYDNNKQQDNPLSLVVVDATKNGIKLTDKNNTTGTIAEYGKNEKEYLKYLYSKGVPYNLFENKPKTKEEIELDRKVGQKYKDTIWFAKLTRQEKSSYIGRGFELTDAQFNLIYNDAYLMNQYAGNGLAISKYQFNKIKENKDYYKTYTRTRSIYVERSGNIGAVDIMMNPSLADKVSDKNAIASEASLLGYHKVVDMMLEKGANNYSTYIMDAVAGGHIDIVKTMIEKGADTFNSCLVTAASYGHKDIVKLMLEKGADNYNGAMTMAAFYGFLDIVKLMLEKGANNYNLSMLEASYKGHIDIIKLMIEKGADNFNEAMAEASYSGFIKVVKLMLEKGANNYEESIKKAKGNGHGDIVELLENHREQHK